MEFTMTLAEIQKMLNQTTNVSETLKVVDTQTKKTKQSKGK